MFKFFKKSYSEKELHLFDFLRKSRLFEKLLDDELAHFTPFLYKREYHSNEVVFFTNDPSQAIYIIKSGIVTLNLELGEGFEKLMTLRSGRLFGDNAVLADTKRIYTAIVMTDDAELYVIPKANLNEIMDNHPAIRAKIMTAFGEIYDEYMANLFKTYKSSIGFFDLHKVYSNL